MPKISVPYGRGRMEAEVPEKNFLGSFEPSPPPAGVAGAEAVEESLDNPVGSPRLEELAAGKNSAVIICSDHTRPVPSRVIIPQMLRRLRKGNPAIDITLLIATGFHRATTREELVGKFGVEIVKREKIVIHDSRDKAALARLGTLPSGGELIVSRLAVEADLLVSEGFIEPHFFAGFSGGRKSVLPGVASAGTVMANHCAEFISSPFSRTGVLKGNPIHKDMIFAAQKAGLAFVVNVALGHDKKVVKSFAGHPERAHEAGCEFMSSFCKVRVPEADVVVTSNGGHPLDQNIYQSVKGMTAGEAACREGGVIVMAASCSDGHGGESFFENMARASSPEALLRQVEAVPRDRTAPDQWQFQILARILSKHTVVLATSDCDPAMIRAMRMEHAPDLRAAVARALEIAGPDAKIAAIPDGVSVIVEKITQHGAGSL